MISHLVIINLILLIGQGVYASLRRNDYHYNQKAGGWLRLHPCPVKWEEAVLQCHSEGSYVASPLDEGISKALSDIMFDHKISIFTGISNWYDKTVFQSEEGVPISDICMNWSVKLNAQLLTSQKTCLAMNANMTVTAVSCEDPRPFVCFRKKEIHYDECGPVGTGYTLDKRTGSCYKISIPLVNWTDAFKTCAREGAHLAIINSETEAQVMWELARNNTSDQIYPYTSIGFTAWGQPRTFLTIHGQSLSDAGYAKWAPNEPNNRYALCGSIYSGGELKDGILNDVKCHDIFKFICEIDPEIYDEAKA